MEDPGQRARRLAILQAYDERHRPALVRLFALVQEMGLVSVRDGVVRVKRKGSCVGCPASTFTLRQWVDARLAERMPGYRGLEVVEESRPDELPRRVTIRLDNQPGGLWYVPSPIVVLRSWRSTLTPARTWQRSWDCLRSAPSSCGRCP
ncbi:MAG: hypothetical protein C4295_10130 [Candidatus Fervidibacterota bacterium]